MGVQPVAAAWRLLGLHHRDGRVDHALGEAPLVVVPGRDLDEVAAVDLGQGGLEDGAARVVVEVDRHERLVVVAEHAAHGLGLARGLHHGVDLLDARRAQRREDQVDEGDVDGRHAHGVALELAVQVRQHQAHGLGGARLRRDHAVAGGAGAAHVLVVDVGDVLVVGAGSSGAFAAAAAVEEGAKTIVIERFSHDGASGIRDTLAGCGSKQQQEDGDDVDKNAAINHLCNWSHGYTRRSLAKVWADRSGETMDWFAARLEEGGMQFLHEIDEKDLPSNYEVLDVGHSTQYGEEYYDQLTMDKVFDYAYALGLQVDYETTMIKLEKKDGRVTGVIAKNAAGEYVRYNAANGVIMATGGYSNNMDMIKALQPWTLEQTCVNYSKAGSKGDGIKACLWAGAIMDTTHTSMIFDRGAVKPDEHGISGQSVPGGWFWMGSQPFLKVNLEAERFMNEYQPYDYVLHQASGQTYHTYCTVWD
ncbi:MAG: FAD-dependent oxidoreductase, partial [Duodenibacillus sp.]|nr:FAD-dependent oxidoreductase [Duodenibacillus sp.]